MAGAVDLHKGEVAAGLDLAILLSLLLRVDVKTLDVGAVEVLVAGPLERVGPGLVAQPVADEVSIAGIDEDRDLLEKLGDKLVVGLHPVAGEEEVAVDVHVAAVIAVDLNTKSGLNIVLVEVLRDPAESRVAEVATVLAVATDVVDVAASALVRTHHGVVAVDAGGNARPDAAGLVASLDEVLASRKGVVHGLALALVQDRGVATLAASHRAVVSVLSKAIGKTVADQNTLQVDVAVLVRQDLGGKDGNVVASIRLSSDVEVLLGVLGELLEEESKESVNILASGDCVANGVGAVREANVDGLVEEDDGSVVVPRVRVVDDLELLVDGSGAELEEETGQRRAARATVEPQDYGVVLGVISGLEEPLNL